LIALILLSGCTAHITQKTREEAVGEESTKVRLGYLQNDLHQLAVWVAREKGWYEEAGIELETKVYKNGGYEMDGFAAEEIDLGYLGTAPAVIKKANAGIDIKQLAQVNAEGSAIIVGPDSNMAGVADLEGKSIAVPGFSTVQYFLVLRALEQNGLGEEDVTFVQTGSPATMRDLMRAGEIDAFMAWEPYCAQAVKEGTGRVLIQSGEIFPGHPCCMLGTRSSYLEENPEVVKKMVDIHVRATDYINENPEEAADIFAADTGYEKELVLEAMENIDYTYYPSTEGTRAYLEFLVDGGKITGVGEGAIDAYLGAFFENGYLEELVGGG